MTGDGILDTLPVPPREELYVSKGLPEKTGRGEPPPKELLKSRELTGPAFVADGFGLATHHGYASNESRNGDRGLENRDILDFYRLYAEGNVCRR